ncbi:MAG TPA: type II secretion system protein GspE, partial [Deltaproteobacteria bacterium]|nr:type II secretion system protein GspE [Deltaproteobacteria bacterium]
MKLGEVLVKANKLTPEQLNLALAAQQKSKEYYLGEILVQQGLSTEEDIATALAELAGVSRVNLETHPIDPAAAAL